MVIKYVNNIIDIRGWFKLTCTFFNNKELVHNAFIVKKLNFIAMKNSLLISFIFCLSFSGFSQYQVHQLISSSGGFYENTDFSVSWSVGEIVTETLSNENTILTQGFQQSFSDPVSIKDDKNNIDGSYLKIYPNPAHNFLTIRIKTAEGENYPNQYQLYNSSGKRIHSSEIEFPETIIDVQTYMSGIYILKLYNSESQYNETHKIQILN